MAEPISLTDSERLALIRDVYRTAYRQTESFQNATGAFLLYLVAAIADDAEGAEPDRCELFPDPAGLPENGEFDEEDDTVVLRNIRALFPPEHAVWGFIEVHQPEGGTA